jgi:hypothetical protein
VWRACLTTSCGTMQLNNSIERSSYQGGTFVVSGRHAPADMFATFTMCSGRRRRRVASMCSGQRVPVDVCDIFDVFRAASTARLYVHRPVHLRALCLHVHDCACIYIYIYLYLYIYIYIGCYPYTYMCVPISVPMPILLDWCVCLPTHVLYMSVPVCMSV